MLLTGNPGRESPTHRLSSTSKHILKPPFMHTHAALANAQASSLSRLLATYVVAAHAAPKFIVQLEHLGKTATLNGPQYHSQK